MTNFTDNELKAIAAIYNDCLNGMGGSCYQNLVNDEYTWTGAKVLMDNGWTKNEAAGTIGALMQKGAITATGDTKAPGYDSHCLNLDGQMKHVLEAIDDNTTPEPTPPSSKGATKMKTKTTPKKKEESK